MNNKLTKDIVRTYELGDINEIPVQGGQIIYQGGAIGINPDDGYARSLQPDDKFVGFAEDHVNALNLSDGQKNVRIRKRGSIILEVAGTSLIDVTKPVYATNDNNFTLSSNNAVYIGQISRFEFDDRVLVDFNASQSLTN